ncbi:MAG: hypothetical protein HOJ35_11805 [Bdellovibrionales bacterium]|jgi:hypothetical protein|nr:hypothetical protein [Bdellovibrionales bacterium]
MSFKLNKIFIIYFIISIISLISLTSYFSFNLWSSGALNKNKAEQVYLATGRLEELKEKQYLKNIKKQVYSDRSRSAVQSFTEFEKRIQKFRFGQQSIKFENNISRDILRVKHSINQLISSPKLSNILKVLLKKVKNFEAYVTTNKWKTLSRMTKKLTVNISNLNTKSRNISNAQKLSASTNKIKKDLDAMISLTQKSILDKIDKDAIVGKAIGFRKELAILHNHILALTEFTNSMTGLNKSYDTWVNSISPEIVIQKIQLEKDKSEVLLLLISIIVLLFLFLISGVFIYKVNYNKDRDSLMTESLSVMKDIISREFNPSSFDQSNTGFNNEVIKIRSYLEKRMSFGTIFQESLPFASILLDSNLNLIWANTLFYDNWGLLEAKYENESLTWDYLQQFTNLGQDDPVIEAIRSKLSGIYQVQVKLEGAEISNSYEMYVSPVEYKNQKRVMIMFYPLNQLEETVNYQMKSIVAPITRSLTAIMNDNFNKEFIGKIDKDFSVSNIDDLLDQLIKLKNTIDEKLRMVGSEVELLEREKQDNCKFVNDSLVIINELKSDQQEIMTSFKNMRNNIVSLISTKGEVEDTCSSISDKAIEIHRYATVASHSLIEYEKSLRSLVDTKESIRESKVNIEEFSARLTRMVKSMLYLNLDDDANKQVKKIYDETIVGQESINEFLKNASALDIALSKSELIINHMEKQPLSINKSDINITNLVSRSQKEEIKIIDSIKSVYLSCMNSSKHTDQLNELMNGKTEEYSSQSETESNYSLNEDKVGSNIIV